MNPENIDKNNFSLYGWCINHKCLPYIFNKTKQKKRDYYIEDIKKIDYSSNLNNKFKNSYEKNGKSLINRLKDKEGVLC